MTAIMHFDTDAYRRAGNCLWTFFAFPRLLADESGLPPDEDAKRLLAVLQHRGIPVGTWVNTIVEDTAYFACPKEAIGPLNDALTALEEQGEFEKGFCAKRTEYLFSLIGGGAEPFSTTTESLGDDAPGTDSSSA
ncbi:MAG: hypothetical protein K1X57_08135 [Gemmataceae bacterium]|nr:hypothetical protein [Gemmataceae bacterium]